MLSLIVAGLLAIGAVVLSILTQGKNTTVTGNCEWTSCDTKKVKKAA